MPINPKTIPRNTRLSVLLHGCQNWLVGRVEAVTKPDGERLWVRIEPDEKQNGVLVMLSNVKEFTTYIPP